MEKKCPNCNSVIISEELTPKIVEVLELFYGEHWDAEINDISMELCSVCGILPEMLPFIEQELKLGKIRNFKNIIKEFDDNLHVPFLLQVVAPILIYIIDNSKIAIQQDAIDELGVYGDEDSLGRYILANQDREVRILGLRALEKIAKYEQKRGKKLDWKDFIDYMVEDDLEMVLMIKKKIKTNGFLQESTKDSIMPILVEIEEKLSPKTVT